MPDKEDHLDKDAALELTLRENGASARVRSRAFNGIDRLVGSVGDFLSAKIEGPTQIIRAKTAAQVAMIEAASKSGVEIIRNDPGLAGRAIDGNIGRMLREQQNKDAVAHAAIEDLKNNSDSGDPEGPYELSPEFLDRLEQKAALASTDVLREKWGRVLAQEIRRPGTITVKALRIVDEISPEAAKAFERFAASRLSDRVFKSLLVDEDIFGLQMLLIEEDLIDNSSALGLSLLTTRTTRGEEELYFLHLDARYGLLFPSSAKGGQPYEEGRILRFGTIKSDQKTLKIDVYRLTNAGSALASILPHDERGVLIKLAKAVGNDAQVPFVEIMEIVSPGQARTIMRWVSDKD